MKTSTLLVVVFGIGAFLSSYADSSSKAPENQAAETKPVSAKQSSESAQAKGDGVGNGKQDAGAKVEDYSAEEKLLQNKRPGNHLVNRTQKHTHAGVSKAMPKPSPNAPKHTPTAKKSSGLSAKASVHEPASVKPVVPANKDKELNKSIGAANKGQTKPTGNRILAARPSELAANLSPKLGAVHGRSSEPVALGGPAMRTSKGAVALSGTAVEKRK